MLTIGSEIRRRVEVSCMSQFTQKELGCLEEMIAFESALYEKFKQYEQGCSEQHIQRLCNQLADRSRQHLTMLSQALQRGTGGSPAATQHDDSAPWLH